MYIVFALLMTSLPVSVSVSVSGQTSREKVSGIVVSVTRRYRSFTSKGQQVLARPRTPALQQLRCRGNKVRPGQLFCREGKQIPEWLRDTD
jgi:hypothetical protein